jgi:hypothetical protein
MNHDGVRAAWYHRDMAKKKLKGRFTKKGIAAPSAGDLKEIASGNSSARDRAEAAMRSKRKSRKRKKR